MRLWGEVKDAQIEAAHICFRTRCAKDVEDECRIDQLFHFISSTIAHIASNVTYELVLFRWNLPRMYTDHLELQTSDYDYQQSEI
jgi:hypothetical protein